MPRKVRLTVNGKSLVASTDEDRPLLEVLREDFGLTGTKYGCGEGECGACTVLLDGIPVRSCLTSIGECEGQSVQTIEGLEQEGRLHQVQESFLNQQAMQCGYCIPGQIMTAVALLKQNPKVSREEIIKTMSEHICRCGSYENILAAVEQAAREQ